MTLTQQKPADRAFTVNRDSEHTTVHPLGQVGKIIADVTPCGVDDYFAVPSTAVASA